MRVGRSPIGCVLFRPVQAGYPLLHRCLLYTSKLLVAEDDPRLLKTLLHIFQKNRFSADGVPNGEEALSHGRTGEYDGIVLDIMMPGMDGLRVLQCLSLIHI